MSDSLVFICSRSNAIHIVDPDEIPHTNQLPLIMRIATEIINAGYPGVAIDELTLRDGRNMMSLEADLASPEGALLQKLSSLIAEGAPIPDVPTILNLLKLAYIARGVDHV